MNDKALGLIAGIFIGFVFAWARLSDPDVIRDMLMLRDGYVFLLMGSSIAVAAICNFALRWFGARALATGEPVGWTVDRIEKRHVYGSVLFGAGWGLAGTCPGPVAVMIGEGQLAGLVVAAGLLIGVALQVPLLRRLRPGHALDDKLTSPAV